jgi:hypothetical protein
MIVVKIAGSLDSFTIVLTKRGYHFVLLVKQKQKRYESNAAYAAYDAPLKPLHLKEKSLVKKKFK